MLENWHQMDGNWLETIKYMHMCSAHMRLLPLSWFSMKLGMNNSFLVVCFTMVQKYLVWEKNTEFSQKYHLMAIKQYFYKMHYFYNKYKRKCSNNFPVV